MTELKRLEISGIRSFKANPANIDTQSIDFDGPITLITGENGTGKTTIIETLKFATMGKCTEEMVTDPKIWGKDEIESKVTLTFKSANQNTYKITLAPSIKKTRTNKKEKAFKKGDCEVTITTPEGSSKIININSNNIESQVPIFFGVSPPIIENVIFCHQKDSCWPIDSSTRELKEKFDQIFGAERYNAAIKALKDTLKNLKDKLNQINIEVVTQNGRQESYIKCENKIKTLREHIITYEDDVYQKQILFDQADAPIQEYNKIKPRIEAINDSIQKLKGQLESNKQSMDELRERIHDLQPKENNASELQSTIDLKKKCNEKFANNKTLLSSKRSNLQILEKERKKISDQVEVLSQKLKSAESEHAFYLKKLHDFKDKYGSEDLDGIKEQKRVALAQAENDLENLDKKLVTDKDNEVRNKEKDLSAKSSQLATLQKEIGHYQKELSAIQQVDSEDLSHAKSNYEKAEYDFHSYGISDSEDLEHKVDAKTKQKQELEKKKESLLTLRKKCNELAHFTQELKNAEEQLQKAEGRIEFHLKAIRDGLNDQTIEPNNAKKNLEQKCNDLSVKISDLSKKRAKVNNELISITQNYSSEESSFIKSKKNAEEAKKKIDEVLQPDDESYTVVCETVQGYLNDETDKLTRLNKSKDVYTGFKEEAKATDPDGGHSCPLCKRKFSSDEELQQFIKDHLDNFINDLPNQIKKTEYQKKMWARRLKELKDIENDVQTYENFQDKKEKWEEKIKNLQNQKDDLGKQLEQVQTEIESNESQLKNLNKLITNAEFLDEAIKEKTKASEVYKNISANIDTSLPSAEYVQNQIDQKEKEIEQLSQEINNLYSDQSRLTKEKNRLKDEVQKYLRIYDSMKADFDKKLSLQTKIETARKEYENLEAHVNEITSQIEKLKNEYNELVDNYDKQSKVKADLKNKARDEFKDCQDLSDQIKNSKRILDELDSGDKSEELKELKEKLENKQNECEKVANDIESLNNENTDLNDKIRNLDEKERNLNLQNDYYKKSSYYENLKNELEKLETEKTRKLGNLGGMNIKELIEEQKRLNDELLLAKRDKANAEKQLAEEQKNAEEYAPSRKLLSEATIRYKSTELAISDIQRYIQALDKTILDYHSQKMAEINDTIQYLWSNTYYGQDIDTIYIRCEEEKAKNAQYNYRVVMKKNNIELDMDRRCSAGQKMLASIIIRLALAQTFALNCGIIALDEPTTNLDEPNRKNLANQLIDLVNAQEKESAIKKPFQLIIITHNREFVESLVEEGTIDSFYQITRAIEDSHHCSQIKKCSETNLVVRH